MTKIKYLLLSIVVFSIVSCAKNSDRLDGTWVTEFGVLNVKDKSNIPILVKEGEDSVFTKTCGQSHWVKNTRINDDLFEGDVKRFSIVDSSNMISYLEADEIVEFNVQKSTSEIRENLGSLSFVFPNEDVFTISNDVCSYRTIFPTTFSDQYTITIRAPYKDSIILLTLTLENAAVGTYPIDSGENNFRMLSPDFDSTYGRLSLSATSGEIEITNVSSNSLSGSFSVVLLGTGDQITSGVFDVIYY